MRMHARMCAREGRCFRTKVYWSDNTFPLIEIASENENFRPYPDSLGFFLLPAGREVLKVRIPPSFEPKSPKVRIPLPPELWRCREPNPSPGR